MSDITETPLYRFFLAQQEAHKGDWKHQQNCYGERYSCISCGCDRQGKYGEIKACISHKGSDAYKNDLLARLVKAQEKIAGIG